VPSPPPPAGEVTLGAATSEVLDIVSSGSASPEEVQRAVDAALEAGLTPEDAAALVSNGAVLGSLDSAQAEKVIAAIKIDKLDAKQKSKLGTALSSASSDVKAAFERSVDVYGGGVDTYVPTGSTVDVAKRRTLVAAAAITGGIAAGAAAGAGAGSRGAADSDDNRRRGFPGADAGLPPGSGTSSAEASAARRVARRLGNKNSGSANIAGPSTDTEGSGLGGLLMRILKQILRELGPMSFTLAGSVIVLSTLSGRTQKIALVATIVAATLHFGHVVLNHVADSSVQDDSDA
jgi:hypothetical protein